MPGNRLHVGDGSVFVYYDLFPLLVCTSHVCVCFAVLLGFALWEKIQSDLFFILKINVKYLSVVNLI